MLFQVNVRTAMAVGQAAGVVMAEAAARGVEVMEYSPNEVKGAVAASGSGQGPGAEDGATAAGTARTAPSGRRGRCRCGGARPRRHHCRPNLQRGGGAMIASVRGELLRRDAATLVVEVAGLGYRGRSPLIRRCR
ncbi:MAG: crossover junction endodeoxyribonuclease RuvC [Microthrixaceae bacterium]|nr:crossover junction endodeoxyribonuclease RuvC [Microthrixaceae bacterium]